MSDHSPSYTTADTGLGTTFERWALNRVLLRLQKLYGFQSALEGPGDGMTGIYGLNSLVLGRQGVKVTALLPDPERVAFTRQVWQMHAPQADVTFVDQWDSASGRLPFADQSFDLAWNFNIMTRVPAAKMLSEMARVSKRYVLIGVPNRGNYAFWLHRLHHRVAHDPWDHGDVGLMDSRPWQSLCRQAGLQVRETFFVDCPWWPDIVDLGQLIADFLPFMKKAARKARPENRLKWEAAQLPYYRPDQYPEIHKQMEKLAFFENSQIRWLKRLFAHHVGVMAEKNL